MRSRKVGSSTIIGIVDVYDALTTNRSYHEAVSQDQALAELTRGVEQGRFRADLVDAVIDTRKNAA